MLLWRNNPLTSWSSYLLTPTRTTPGPEVEGAGKAAGAHLLRPRTPSRMGVRCGDGSNLLSGIPLPATITSVPIDYFL